MDDLDTVFEYHQRTKHHFHRHARSLGYMDWDNQPHPFRHYTGAGHTGAGHTGAGRIQLDLERQPAPQSYRTLYDPGAVASQPVDLGTLADFFRYGLALTAWKQSGQRRWALRVDPSSGNLHPTEAYVFLRSLSGVDEAPGLYHYMPDLHALERRALFPAAVGGELFGELPSGSMLVGLSSIPWRESWKYGERAFRYCQHDMGHVLAALRFSAALCGWRLRLVPSWSTDDVAALLGLDRKDEFLPQEHEEPELIALVTPQGTDADDDAELPPPSTEAIHRMGEAQWYGRPNRLSSDHTSWPVIDEAIQATRMPRGTRRDESAGVSNVHPRAARNVPDVDARQIIHQRRSCLSLDGSSSVARETFLHMMQRLLPGRHPPWDVLTWIPTMDLAVFVHRVDGLSPGLYMLVRDPRHRQPLVEATRREFLWTVPDNVPDNLPFYLLVEGDFREQAQAISCHQEIAADGFFSLGMIADFAEPLQQHGAWFYRNLFWESGVIGQVLYLEAEAAGYRSTGIGCYFDDPMHDVLGLSDRRYQSLYHFTVGVPVEDHRLQTWPPYSHLDPA